MQVLKKHIGRPCDFQTTIGKQNGIIEDVRKKIVTIRYWLNAPFRYEPEGYITYKKFNEIIEVY